MNGHLIRFSAVEIAWADRRAVRPAVRGVSFAIGEREFFCLVGESGSGKTSLARAILGLAPVTAGRIDWRGTTLAGSRSGVPRELRRRVQYVFQDPIASLSPRRRVGQTLREPLALYRHRPRQEWPQRIAAALEDVGLDGRFLDRYPHELSGGEAQRVAIARALLAEPELLVADEPTSALDVTVQARLVRLLRDLQAARRIAVLFISHNLALVAQVADRVAVLYRGELLEIAAAAELFSAPAHPYTQVLLDAAPSPDPRQRSAIAFAPARPDPALTPEAGCVFHSLCPRAIDRCATHEPVAWTVGDATRAQPHLARCHLCRS